MQIRESHLGMVNYSEFVIFCITMGMWGAALPKEKGGYAGLKSELCSK